jgi:hypothetical protein
MILAAATLIMKVYLEDGDTLRACPLFPLISLGTQKLKRQNSFLIAYRAPDGALRNSDSSAPCPLQNNPRRQRLVFLKEEDRFAV